MKKEQTPREKPSRRTFTKSVVTALATAPVVVSMIGCRRGDQTEGGPTPTPTPLKAKPMDGDTPITVGGGGGTKRPHAKDLMDDTYTKIKFDHSHFTNALGGGDDKHYKNNGEQAEFAWFNDGQEGSINLTRYMGDGDIKLQFRNSQYEVTITQKPFGVKFKGPKYVQPTGDPNAEHHSDDPVLKKIVLDGKTFTVTVGSEWFVCVSKDPRGGDCK